jgi:transcriptional regulator with XRE-family HTH domain
MAQGHMTKAALARHIGAVSREARLRARMTQEQVAERVEIVAEVYGRLERGVMLPSLPTLMRLCRALALDANSLLGFSCSHRPSWLQVETSPDTEAPALRRLLRTARRLKPAQLRALGQVASVLLSPSPSRTSRGSKHGVA